MEVPSSLQLSSEYSIPLALISLLVYVPRVPFLINDIQRYLGCTMTYLVLVLYLVLSVDLTVQGEVANGLLHIFSALLGTATNLLICGPLGEAEVQVWAKDLALLVSS